MWLSLLSVVALIVCCSVILVITHSWNDIKSCFSHLRNDLRTIEPNNQPVLVQIISFSKLWFRKQFALIDKELLTMPPSILRTGLVAIREDYEQTELEKTLTWQRQEHATARLKTISPIETLSQTLITVAMLVGVCVLTIQVSFIAPSATLTLGMPTLFVLATALALQSFLVKPLLQRLLNNLHSEQAAQQLCVEGITLIHQRKTPAQVRALMEGMLKGLEASKHAPMPLNRPRSSTAAASLVQRKAS